VRLFTSTWPRTESPLSSSAIVGNSKRRFLISGWSGRVQTRLPDVRRRRRLEKVARDEWRVASQVAKGDRRADFFAGILAGESGENQNTGVTGGTTSVVKNPGRATVRLRTNSGHHIEKTGLKRNTIHNPFLFCMMSRFRKNETFRNRLFIINGIRSLMRETFVRLTFLSGNWLFPKFETLNSGLETRNCLT